ncbi:unnamed protein product [Cuscuta europaea]|uniref:VOC domain-containing protein n=1 Tax=Cuscuta europaea TaxID=41803 RepID=A0A9P0YS89_CUSEU|nr:unnamed protein product [Cuscuta europaea]
MAEEAQNGGATNGAAKAVTFSALKPQLFVEGSKANDAVQFYKTAFGAEEVSRVMNTKRKAEQEVPLILYAELKLGSTVFLVSDLTEDSSAPAKADATSGVFALETDDVETAIANAVSAGAVAEGEISEGEASCCGGRVGKVKDPYGNLWFICSPAKKSVESVEA